MTLPQALAQSLQCPLLDPDAAPPRPLPARTLPGQHCGQTVVLPASGGYAASADQDSSPLSEASTAHAMALSAAAVKAQDTDVSSPARAEAVEAAGLLLTGVDHQPAPHPAQTTSQQQKMNSFMVSGQRRVAKRPRVREHRRCAV
jgi:hypothetical protein